MNAQMTRRASGSQAAVLDSAHVGDIRGAFGSIKHGDAKQRDTWRRRTAAGEDNADGAVGQLIARTLARQPGAARSGKYEPCSQ